MNDFHFNFYLTGHFQKLFGINPKSIKPHSLAEIDKTLTEEWYTLWRLDHAISSKTQNVIIATNEQTAYSFLIVIDKHQGIDDVMNSFFGYWLDALISHGYLPKKNLIHKSQYLRGGSTRSISNLSQLSCRAWNLLDRGSDLSATLEILRSIPLKGNDFIYPKDAFAKALIKQTPPNLKIIPIPATNHLKSFQKHDSKSSKNHQNN